MNILKKTALFIILINAVACSIEEVDPNAINPQEELVMVDSTVVAEIRLSNSIFNFETTAQVDLSLQVTDMYGESLKSVPVEVFAEDPSLQYDEEASSGKTPKAVYRGVTTEAGQLKVQFAVPTYATKLYICPRYIGVLEQIEISLQDNAPHSIATQSPSNRVVVSKKRNSAIEVGGFVTLGGWNETGVPDYLSVPSDKIEQSFLAVVNENLPSGKALPTLRPDLFNNSFTSELHLKAATDVYISFLHEGAGWKNSFGYYTYDENTPPQSLDDVELHTIVFPNTSFKNSGGGMASGNKVNLGNFEAGTVIGWFLVAKGWSEKQLTHGSYKVYSSAHLNPEQDASLQQHFVTFLDEESGKYIVGVEDIRRDRNSCDNDFNDLVVYATVSNPDAVKTGGVAVTEPVVDTDEDGVSDSNDEYPEDPRYAFNNYSQGSLAYEDLWPNKGDYDFNDLVLQYNINQLANADNKIASIQLELSLEASGAGFRNGFGIELPLTPEQIETVTGHELTSGFVQLNANGTEAGQKKAVIIAFENYFGLMSKWNVYNDKEHEEAFLISMEITLKEPVSVESLGSVPYNPFMIVNGQRGKEVHLPGMKPTTLANLDLFGTGADTTDPANNVYYKTANNLPWGLHLPIAFDYPAERNSIEDAYLHFTQWAESNGTDFSGWYLNEAGNRNEELLYKKGE